MTRDSAVLHNPRVNPDPLPGKLLPSCHNKMLHQPEQSSFERLLYRRLAPALFACLLLAAGAALPASTRAQGGAAAQPSPRPRVTRVTPLRKSDSAQGSRVTITSDGGAISEYSAYRSGDRFIVVIPRAEAVGGGGGVSGRGFQGAQVSKRGNDLVYTFKLEPGATARVNQRFNQLDVQFTASKSAATTTSQPAANSAPAATPTPRPQRTPAELAGLPSPTPAARATPDTTRVVRTDSNAEAAGVAPPAGTTAPTPSTREVSVALPGSTPTPELTPTVAPPAEQIAQVLPTPAAPVGAPATSASAPSRTLGATVSNNWPWILAALLAVGVALLFVGRLGSRREKELPPAQSTAPALRERPSAQPVGSATATPVESAAKFAAVPVVAKPAPGVTTAPVSAREAQAETPVAAAKPKKLTKAERRREKQSKAAAERRAAAEKSAVAGKPAAAKETDRSETPAAVEAKAGVSPVATPDAAATTPVAAAIIADAAKPARAPAEEKGIVLAAADAEVAGAEIQKLLAGETYNESVVGAPDSATRQLVAAELAAALAGRNAERNARARAAFLKHGYFDDAARDLQTAEAPGQRASAALSLALVGDHAATPHLVAALEDPSADVRRASIEALSQLKDPTACAPLEALRWRERSRQVPQSLIRHAIEACTPAEAEADDTPVADEETIITESLNAAPGAAEDTAAETAAVETAAVETTTVEAGTAAPDVDDNALAESPAAETQTVEAFPVHSPAFEPPPVDAVPFQPPAAEPDDLAAQPAEASSDGAAAEILPEPVDDTAYVYPADAITETRPASMRAEPAGEEAIEIAPAEKGFAPAEDEKSVELATEEKGIELAAEEKGVALAEEEEIEFAPEAPTVVEPAAAPPRASFVEPSVEAESPLASGDAAPSGTELAGGEVPAPARDFAAVEEAGSDVHAGQKGLAAHGEADELSIIPKAIQLRLDSPDATERAESVRALARLNTDAAYKQICEAFDDRDVGVRDAAARALHEVADDRAESFTRALREAGPERRRNIGAALSSSGLAEEAISQLTGESRDKTYDAFSLLFLMAKAGETAPLIRAIESHPDHEVRLAVVKLLALSGQQEVLPAFRRLAVRGSLPAEVRSAVMEAIYQISGGGGSHSPAATNRAH